MEKKERVIAALGKKAIDYVHCGFSLHLQEYENSDKTGFILGADCTLATEQDMHRLSAAVNAARSC